MRFRMSYVRLAKVGKNGAPVSVLTANVLDASRSAEQADCKAE